MDRFLETLLTKGRVPGLALVVVITTFSAWQCLGLRVDRENRSMRSDSEELGRVEAEFESRFGKEEALLAAVQGCDLATEEGRGFLRDLAANFAAIEGTAGVSSLADTGFAILPFQEGLFVSADRRTTGLAIQLDQFDDDGASLERIIGEARRIADGHTRGGTRVALTGLPLEKYESARLVLRDQRIFSPLSLLVLGVVLLWVTRDLRATSVILLIAGITICWTLGCYALSGRTLNMVTSLLPPVVMTISVAASIHVYLEWEGGGGGNAGTVAALRKLHLPCLFAAITTIIGFLSLVLSHTPAVRSFGLFAGLGVGFGFFLGTGFLAVCLSYLKPRPAGRRGHLLADFLGWAAPLPLKHPKKVVALAVVLAAAGTSGIGRVENNTDLLRFLGEENRLVEDTRFIEEHLTGTNTIELVLTRADGSPFAPEDLEKARDFAGGVEQLPHVRHTLGPWDLAEIPAFPTSDRLRPPSRNSHLSGDGGTVRITARIDSIGTREGAGLIDRIHGLCDSKFGDSIRLEEAGDFNRVVVESNELTASQLRSFGVAIVLILLSIGLVFRSPLFLALAILPNVAPLLMAGAIMGFAGIDLSTGTAMIASVVIGLAVDDTIHFLAGFRRTFDGDCAAALLETARTSGFAIVATTLTLSAGFWVAIFGSFQPTVHFALLSGLTMWFALAFDLFVLPACLRLAHGRPRSTPP